LEISASSFNRRHRACTVNAIRLYSSH